MGRWAPLIIVAVIAIVVIGFVRNRRSEKSRDGDKLPTGFIGVGQNNLSLGGHSVLSRYLDLYRIARLLVKIGDIVKVIGIVIGIGIPLLFLLGGIDVAVVSSVLGTIVGGIIYLLGILIAAQGQILLAQADSAVHTSPFMTDEEKAKVMSIPFKRSVEKTHRGRNTRIIAIAASHPFQGRLYGRNNENQRLCSPLCECERHRFGVGECAVYQGGVSDGDSGDAEEHPGQNRER